MNETNLKLRQLKCPNCNLIVTTDKPNPSCESCGHTLITIIKSSLTGQEFIPNNSFDKFVK